jgi:hypothetical protein
MEYNRDMKLALIMFLAIGCGGSKSDAPKVDCDAYARAYVKAAGMSEKTAQDVFQAAQTECKAGGISQQVFDCAAKATSSAELDKCDKLRK